MQQQLQITNIYLVRHGETYHGKEIFWSRKQGRSLNKQGKLQIAKGAEYLSKMGINSVYFSPLKRTTESAFILKKMIVGLSKFQVEESLIEWDIGFKDNRVEGVPFAVLGPEYEKVYTNQPTSLVGGEPLLTATSRITQFVISLVDNCPGANIICVTHQDMIRGAVLHFEKKDLNLLDHIPCRHASIYHLTFENQKFRMSEYLDLNSKKS